MQHGTGVSILMGGGGVCMLCCFSFTASLMEFLQVILCAAQAGFYLENFFWGEEALNMYKRGLLRARRFCKECTENVIDPFHMKMHFRVLVVA